MMTMNHGRIGFAGFGIALVMMVCGGLMIYTARQQPAPAPHHDNESAVGIPWDADAMMMKDDADVRHHDERKRRLYCDALETQLTSSLLKGNHVVELYPGKPALIRRGFDGKDRESLILEVQRSQDKAVDGKTRFRTYTWVLDDVKEELR